MFVKSWARLAGREVVGSAEVCPKEPRTFTCKRHPRSADGRSALDRAPTEGDLGLRRRGLPEILVCSFRVTCPGSDLAWPRCGSWLPRGPCRPEGAVEGPPASLQCQTAPRAWGPWPPCVTSWLQREGEGRRGGPGAKRCGDS